MGEEGIWTGDVLGSQASEGLLTTVSSTLVKLEMERIVSAIG